MLLSTKQLYKYIYAKEASDVTVNLQEIGKSGT